MLTLSLPPHTTEHWPPFSPVDDVVSPDALVSPGGGATPQRDNGWLPFIETINEWLSRPDSVPTEESWVRPSEILLRHALRFARDMHMEGLRRPSVLTPIPDGGVAFQLHSENYGRTSGDWHTVSFDMYNDGTADSSYSRSNGESDFVTVRLGFGNSE